MATVSLIAQQRPMSTLSTDGTETVLDAIQYAGLGAWVDAECGGSGTCGRCKCRVTINPPRPTASEQDLLSPEELDNGIRLACQLSTDCDITVELTPPVELRRAKAELAAGMDVPIPDRARHDTELSHACAQVGPATLRKVVVSMAPPDLHDQRSDWQRLCEALVAIGFDTDVAATTPPLPVLRHLPAALRAHSAHGHPVATAVPHARGGKTEDYRSDALRALSATAILHGQDVIGIEPGDTTGTLLAAAVDIGTTTVATYLLDAISGRVLAVAAGANPQSGFGADVISRISAVQDNPAALTEMQRLIIGTIGDLLTEAAGRAGVAVTPVYELVAVGNPCMLHLLIGVDPIHLAGSPYIPAFSNLLYVPAAELGLRLSPAARVCLLPGVSGYVGADIVADVVATELHRLPGARLLIDVGTNGEMVLAHNGRLISCATAAGPAFEGAHIACGMRAASGAIEHVSLDDRLELAVIDSGGQRPAEPIGLCGSGLLDAIAAMVRLGVVDLSGRIQAADRLPFRHLASRLFSRNGSSAFRLAGPPDRPVYISQHDVRQVQMAKGAIRTGINMMLQEFGLDYSDLDEVLLAGAFGSYLSPESALIIGMLPPVDVQRVRAVGNTAGDGARLASASAVARAEAVAVGKACEYIELSVRKDFQAVFLKEVVFPAPSSVG